jgi:hypothetical protein
MRSKNQDDRPSTVGTSEQPETKKNHQVTKDTKLGKSKVLCLVIWVLSWCLGGYSEVCVVWDMASQPRGLLTRGQVGRNRRCNPRYSCSLSDLGSSSSAAELMQ